LVFGNIGVEPCQIMALHNFIIKIGVIICPHLLPSIAFFTLIMFRSWIFPYLYAIVSGVYVCNMIYSYIQLTTGYKGFPDEIEKVLISFMLVLYLIAFIDVFLNFLNHTIRQNDALIINLAWFRTT
jgi:predicted CDP-diglyceride synthetase/phosphatidate cytidylyltransferase